MNVIKKIYIIGEYYPPLDDWLVNGTAPKGMPAVYNLYHYLGNHPTYTFNGIIYNPLVARSISFPNGSVLELKKFTFPLYRLWKLLILLKLYIGKHHHLRNHKYDLIYGLGSFAVVARKLGSKYNIKSAGRIFGTILTPLVKDQNYVKIYSRHILEVLNIKYPPDIVIATRDGTKYNEVVTFFKSKKMPLLLYNGMHSQIRSQLLDYPLINILPSNEILKICQISRLQSYKRTEISLEIVNELVNKYKVYNIALTIVGSGPMAPKIHQLIVNMNLEKYVAIIDEVSHQDLMELIKDQHIATFFYEGGSLGNIFWECALAGKLICTVDNGDTASIIEDGVNGVIKADDRNLAHNIAESIFHLRGKDISEITQACRSSVSEIITTWKERYDNEFDYIFNET